MPTVEGDAQPADSDMAIDYALYGEAEALLGWLNARVRLDGIAPFDGNAWLRDMAARLQADLDERGIQIMHLKVTLSPGEEGGLAVLNQVRSEQPAELSRELIGLLAARNCSSICAPKATRRSCSPPCTGALGEAAAAAGLRTHVQQVEHLRPGQPTPTHRLSPV